MVLTDHDTYQLKKMIEAHKVDDQTSQIRELSQSKDIYTSIEILLRLKQEHAGLYAENKPEFEELCMKECSFLFYHFFDIYNKIIKDQISLPILYQLLDILSKIEKGEVDQHEGSYLVGKILKEIYIDSKLQEMKHLDEVSEQSKPLFKEAKIIGWKEYKQLQLDTFCHVDA